MKRFLIKVIFFSVPILMIFGISALILRISGESYTDIDDIIISNNDYLIGYAYDESNYKYLKWKELDTRETQTIIALGSSRILQFREQMFSKSFYNAGNTISNISAFLPFIKSSLKNKYPEILIISLDQWMFNKNWMLNNNFYVKLTDSDKDSGYNYTFNKYPSGKTVRNMWKDIIKQKYGFKMLILPPPPLLRLV